MKYAVVAMTLFCGASAFAQDLNLGLVTPPPVAESGIGKFRIGIYGEYWRPDFKDSKNLITNAQGSGGIGGYLNFNVWEEAQIDLRVSVTYFFEFSTQSNTDSVGLEGVMAFIWRPFDMAGAGTPIHPYAGVGVAIDQIWSSVPIFSAKVDTIYGANFIVGILIDLTPNLGFFVEGVYKYRADGTVTFTLGALSAKTDMSLNGGAVLAGFSFRP